MPTGALASSLTPWLPSCAPSLSAPFPFDGVARVAVAVFEARERVRSSGLSVSERSEDVAVLLSTVLSEIELVEVDDVDDEVLEVESLSLDVVSVLDDVCVGGVGRDSSVFGSDSMVVTTVDTTIVLESLISAQHALENADLLVSSFRFRIIIFGIGLGTDHNGRRRG